MITSSTPKITWGVKERAAAAAKQAVTEVAAKVLGDEGTDLLNKITGGSKKTDGVMSVEEAKAEGALLTENAKAEGEQLIEKAGDAPLKKLAAQKSADLLIKNAEKKAAKLISDAEAAAGQ